MFKRFSKRPLAYRLWCRIAFPIYMAIPGRWIFSAPARWLSPYANHFAHKDWNDYEQAEKRACRTCAFAGRRQGADDYPCKRRAPVALEVQTYNGVPRQVVPTFPVMHGYNWCGDYAPRTTDHGGGDG